MSLSVNFLLFLFLVKKNMSEFVLDKLKMIRSKYELNLEHKYFHLLQAFVFSARLRRALQGLLYHLYELRLKKRFFTKLYQEAIVGIEVRQCCRLVKTANFIWIADYLKYSKNVFMHLNPIELRLIYVVNFEQTKLMRRYFDRMKVRGIQKNQ